MAWCIDATRWSTSLDYDKSNECFMLQVAHFTDAVDGFLLGKSYLVLDRDAKCSWAFRSLIVNPASGQFSCHRDRPI
jgi:hypothetical protein